VGISLAEAAKQVGMTKAGVKKAIAKGRIKAEKNELGEWVIDASDLFRLYPPLPTNQDKPVNDGIQSVSSNENRILEVENKLLREQIELLKDQLQKADENQAKTMKVLEEQVANVRLLADLREKKEGEGRGFWRTLFK
jgi:hypothetical protein